MRLVIPVRIRAAYNTVQLFYHRFSAMYASIFRLLFSSLAIQWNREKCGLVKIYYKYKYVKIHYHFSTFQTD